MMRDPLVAATIALGVLITALLVAALYLGNSKPEAHAQQHNPYWPFTVELQVRDK